MINYDYIEFSKIYKRVMDVELKIKRQYKIALKIAYPNKMFYRLIPYLKNRCIGRYMTGKDKARRDKIKDLIASKKSEEEKAARQKAVQDATRYATEVPFKTMKQCYECMSVAKAMAEIGNPNSVTDAGVGALAARAGVMGAFLNVKINAAGLEDKEFAAQIIREGEAIVEKANELEAEILKIVNSKI